MAEKVNNIPSPEVLMNSMRSIGYNFKTAIADIIDNSISANAKNIYITSPINNDELYITIIDDGIGMSQDELFNAMKYGSDKECYNENDLGRFGLGLKSASLSQCRILTVASKANNKISAFQWNLDRVIQDKEWVCLKLDNNEINNIPNINDLKNQTQGTIVVWQNFDIGFKKSGGHVREYISNEIEDARQHISLIFHRFLSNKFNPLKIYINKDQVIPVDPFLENHPKTDTKDPSELDINGSKIKVQPFILPYQTDLSNEDIIRLGGIDSLRNGQGFYIYRNERLIVYGTWFRLSKFNISNELYKYGRIKVDIPNTLDDTWDIDIKKQNATVPRQILNNLKNIVSNVCSRSQSKSAKRTKLTLEKDNTKIWCKKLSRDNKEIFEINSDSEFVASFIDEFDDKDKSRIIKFLEIVSSTIPVDDIYSAICKKNNETQVQDDVLDLYVLEGVEQFKKMKSRLQQNNDKIFERMSLVEPYNDEKVINAIRERVANEKY